MKTFLAAAFIVMAGSLTISAQHAAPLSGREGESQHVALLPNSEADPKSATPFLSSEADPKSTSLLPHREEGSKDAALLPRWEEGFLDIHTIATGRGDACLIIMPDGTTMMIDAGDNGKAKDKQHPDGSMKPLSAARTFSLEGKS